MIQSFVFNEGKLAACNLPSDALRLVRADKGLLIWVTPAVTFVLTVGLAVWLKRKH